MPTTTTTAEPASSEWWPSRIGRLVLDDALAKVVATYVDPLTSA